MSLPKNVRKDEGNAAGMGEPDEEPENEEAGSREREPLLPKEQRGGLCAPLTWLYNLSDKFGYKLLVMLFVVQHCQKGFMASFTSMAEPYLYRTYKVPAPQVQIYSSVSGLPWVLKPIIGLVSDVMPVMGYKKAPYMFVTSLGCTAACLVLGLMAHSLVSVTGLVICLFVINLQYSTCDLLSEAKYAEKIRSAPGHGPALLSFVWFGMQMGGLAATLGSGPVIHAAGPKIPYLVAAFPAMAVMVPVALGFMEEQKSSPEEAREIRQRYYQQREACALCFLMLGSGVALAVCGVTSGDPLANCVVAIVVAIVVVCAFSLVLSPVIAKFNAFALIQGALGLSIGGASFYFYTDTEEMYPEGPHFSEFFYNSVMGTLGSVCSLIGIYFYQRYMSSWKYRNLIVFTNVVASLLSCLDIVMFARLNKHIGIPDHVLVLGLSALETVIFQWRWMPQVVILSYLCPKGMEATMYALLAGCANLGNSVASNCGAMMLNYLGCRPSGQVGESEQFKNLWVAASISTVLPLVACLLLIRLVPDARQDEQIVRDEETDATTGSLLRSWWKRE
mmetsp:Transcript_108908/g.318711  ORF Transcript_108908/g.318711 Transcript_108908/m.318711 type:complete len:561 (-) Transcript_108908:118-1800(-)